MRDESARGPTVEPTRENEVRCRRIGWAIDDLERRLGDWTAHRRADGWRNRSQIDAVAAMLAASASEMREALGAVDRSRPPGEVFARSRAVGDAVVWLERVWRYFGDRFDQRDVGDPRAPTVLMADDVVWSCYRPPYEHPRVARLDLPHRPPPLPFVEAEYSPAARTIGTDVERRLEPSAALQALEEIAGELPISLLSLPPWCVGAPWWLVFVAHETGHHLQPELDLILPMREAVREAAGAAGGTPKDIDAWGRWSEEIFADFWSLVLMGPWALWALVEVERKPPRAMALRRSATRYPPSIVRLRIMADALERLGIDPTPALRGVERDPRPTDLGLSPPLAKRLERDLRIGDEVAKLMTHDWPHVGRLDRLAGFDASDFEPRGEVERWALELLRGSLFRPSRDLDAGRTVIAASVAAWAHLSAKTPLDELPRAVRGLSDAVHQAIQFSSSEGVRGAPSAPAPSDVFRLERDADRSARGPADDARAIDDMRSIGRRLGTRLLELAHERLPDDVPGDDDLADDDLADDSE